MAHPELNFELKRQSDDRVTGSHRSAAHLVIAELLEQNARLKEALQKDDLTGLPNREGARAAFEAMGASRTRGWLGVFDLDKFKAVNDNLGHDVGDKVLVGVGEKVSDALRADDIVARWGGDEFVVLLSEIDAQGALKVGSKVCQAVRSLGTTTGFDLPQDFGATFAIAPIEATASFEDNFVRADNMLIEAKLREERGGILVLPRL